MSTIALPVLCTGELINALSVTSYEIDAFFLVTITFAEDKCRKLNLLKNQVLNDLEQKEKDNT